MNTDRKIAVAVGILFIIGTVSGILSGVMTAATRTGATYPLNVDASETQWINCATSPLKQLLDLS